MHHNGCDNYLKFLVFDFRTSLICACISQYYYKCMFSDYQRYSVWLRIRIWIYFYISSCPAATTRLSLVLPMEHFSSPSQPLGPVQCKKVKHWRYRGAAQIINSFISFSQENAPQLFQYLWSHEAKTVVTCLACKCMRYNFEPCRLIIFSKFSSLNLCKMYGHLCEEYWQIDLSFQTLLISGPYYHPQ